MFFSPKTSADGLVFHYDTGNTTRSYVGEPTANLLPEGVAATHDAASGNAVTVTDAANEKGPGWKKVTITTRGSNFRTLQWTYLTMTANITYCHSVVFDWGNMKGKNYFIYFDGNGTGVRTYYRPGNYSTAGSELIDNSMPNGKFAGVISHTSDHTHAFFIGNYTTNIGSLNDFFYYKEFQIEAKTHPTPFTTGTRSATQGLKDLTANRIINIANVTFDANAQITFDGTDDSGQSEVFNPGITNKSFEAVTRLYNVNHQAGGVIGMMGESGEPFDTIVYNETDQGWGFGSTGFQRTAWSSVKETTTGFVHLIATYADYNYKLYRNSQLILTTTSYPILNYNFNTIIIFGKRHASTTGPYLGEIPVAKIYNRALTADEVARNFNAVKSRFNIA